MFDRKRRGVLCAVVASAVVVPAASADLVIDDFTSGPFEDLITSGMNVTQQDGTMLGGQRDIGYQVTGNPFGEDLQVTVDTTTGLLFSAGVGVRGDLGLDYDGLGDEEDANLPFVKGDGLGGLDLTGMDRITIDFLMSDLPLEISVILQTFDESGEIIGEASNTRTVGASGDPFGFDLLFAEFVVDSGTPSFADVDRLIFSFNIDDAASRDFAISRIYGAGVPGPGAGALLAVVGLFGARRTRRV